MKRTTCRASLLAALCLLIVVAAMPPAGAAVPTVPDDTWGVNGQVSVILRVGGVIYLGGDFTAVEADNGATMVRNHLAAIDATTGQPTSFNPNVNGSVFGLATSPDASRLYVTGTFGTVGGVSRKNIAAVALPSGAVQAWKAAGGPNSTVRSIAVSGSTVYIGGSFNTLGTTPRAKLAALSAVDGSILPWAPTADGLVRDIVLANGLAYLGGNFVTVNGTAQRAFAGVDPGTGASACPLCFHPGYPVLDIEAGPNRVFLAGGGGGGKAVAVSGTTGAKLWETRTDGNVQAVGILSGTPYFGGHFFKYTGVAVNQLVRVDPATGVLDATWLPNVTAGFLGVFAVRGFNANLYVGGDFTRVGGSKQLNFAQFTDDAVAASVDLGVTLADAPDPVDAGSPLTYTATVTNGGPDGAAGVTVSDALPADATFSSASASCTYAPGPHTVTCDLGSIAAGGSSAPQITVIPGTAGPLTNTVTASSLGTDTDPADNTATATTTVHAVSGADLNLTMTPGANAKIDQGSSFDYGITVTNQGPDTEPAATVTDVLPSNVTKNGQAIPSQGSCTGVATVTCNLGAMNAGAVATITVHVTAPAQPVTVVNTASVQGLANDVDPGDDGVTRYTAVRDPAASADTTAPAKTAMSMLDQNEDGFVDRVVVTFNETLAPCVGSCTAGWALTDVPSAGALQSVNVSGNQATLVIAGWQNLQDTAVGLFKVSLASPNQLQDANGNRPSFAASAPADGASPVAVGFRKGHNNTGAACAGAPTNAGLAEPCDELTSEWSEALAPSSIPATTTVRITDPAGVGNDTLTVTNFIQGSMDLGSNVYLTPNDASASWAASSLSLQGAAKDTLTVRILGACTGTGCGSLASAGNVTVVYVPSALIEDIAGNPAAGSFTKTQKMF